MSFCGGVQGLQAAVASDLLGGGKEAGRQGRGVGGELRSGTPSVTSWHRGVHEGGREGGREARRQGGRQTGKKGGRKVRRQASRAETDAEE